MDVHKLSITAAVMPAGTVSPVIDKVSSDAESVRRLVGRFEDPTRVWACYEAGPTGYELARQLRDLGVRVAVIAPSLIPTAPGDRVKTDRRDARRLASLFANNQLCSVRVPTPAEEAVRDLCRARADMVIDRTRTRHRLGKFLLRHGRVWAGGDNWTLKHEAWIRAQRFDEPAARLTFEHYRATLELRDAALNAIDTDLAGFYHSGVFTDPVGRLCAYRGITELGALTLASEVCDWKRFPTAGMFMSFCALVPSEHSSGQRTSRGGITHAGNTHLRTQLVESAWAYKARPAVGATLRHRQDHATPATVARAWSAQTRLCSKFGRLDARKTNRKTVVTAIARELAGFVWAEMTAA